eukprot:5067114-Pleurochrysis_carterae.AAC.2
MSNGSVMAALLRPREALLPFQDACQDSRPIWKAPLYTPMTVEIAHSLRGRLRAERAPAACS